MGESLMGESDEKPRPRGQNLEADKFELLRGWKEDISILIYLNYEGFYEKWISVSSQSPDSRGTIPSRIFRSFSTLSIGVVQAVRHQ